MRRASSSMTVAAYMLQNLLNADDVARSRGHIHQETHGAWFEFYDLGPTDKLIDRRICTPFADEERFFEAQGH